jgi:hypothetical protein
MFFTGAWALRALATAEPLRAAVRIVTDNGSTYDLIPEADGQHVTVTKSDGSRNYRIKRDVHLRFLEPLVGIDVNLPDGADVFRTSKVKEMFAL